MLPPQVTARQGGPPPTAVSTVKQPPSPMQVDYKPSQHIPPVALNYRAKDYLQFLSMGNRQGKVFAVNGNPAEIVVQYNRPNRRPPHFIKYCQYTGRSDVLKALDSKYHVPVQWEAASKSANNCLTAKPESLCHATRSSSATPPRVRSTEPSQNQNSLLVKCQNDNTSPGDWPRKISP